MLVVATPVYKAAYSGVLKVFLDLLAANGLKGKTVLPWPRAAARTTCWRWITRCGPCCSRWGQKHILPGIYATDSQVTLSPEGSYSVHSDVAVRLDDAVNLIITETPAAHAARGRAL